LPFHRDRRRARSADAVAHDAIGDAIAFDVERRCVRAAVAGWPGGFYGTILPLRKSSIASAAMPLMILLNSACDSPYAAFARDEDDIAFLELANRFQVVELHLG
jgi:hypothetical protein